MASIFSLFGTIFIDNSEADKSIDRTTEKAEKSGSKIGNAFSAIAKGAVAVGAAVVTGAAALGTAAYKMASDTAAAADNVDKMSQKIGISRTAYQEWDYVMSQCGMNVDQLQTGVKTLTSQIDAAASGNASAAETFKKLGVSVQNADGSLRSQEEVFEETIKALQNVENETERARLATELFGKAGTEMAPLLNASAESIKELKEKAHELGMVMSDETIDAGVTFTDSIDTIKRSLSGAMNTLGGTVLPIVQKVLDLIIDKLPLIQGLFDRLSPVLNEVFDGILQPLFDLVETLLPTLFDTMETLLPVMEDVISAVLPVIVNLLQKLMPFLVQIIKQVLPIAIQLIQGIMPLITQILDTILPIIIQLLQALLPPIIEIIEAVLPVVIQLLETLLPPILLIIDSILPVLIMWLDAIMPVIQPILNILLLLIEPVLFLLNSVLPQIMGVIQDFTQKIMPPLQAIFESVAEAITGRFKNAFDGIKAVVENIKAVYAGIIDFVKNVFTGNWKGAWESVVKIFSNVFEGIKNAFKVPINWIIDGINSFIRGLNKVKIPDWVPGVGGYGLNIAELTRLRIGMEYVPYDDMPALLHKGERVLTASENKEYSEDAQRKGSGEDTGNQVNVNIVFDEKAVYIENLSSDSESDVDGFVDTLLELIEEKIKRKGIVFA